MISKQMQRDHHIGPGNPNSPSLVFKPSAALPPTRAG